MADLFCSFQRDAECVATAPYTSPMTQDSFNLSAGAPPPAPCTTTKLARPPFDYSRSRNTLGP